MKTKKLTLMLVLAVTCVAVFALMMGGTAMAVPAYGTVCSASGCHPPVGDTTAPPGSQHGDIELKNDFSWGRTCNNSQCHSKKHQKNCTKCHGPGGREDVHLVSAHSNCSLCHDTSGTTLACVLACHTFTPGSGAEKEKDKEKRK